MILSQKLLGAAKTIAILCMVANICVDGLPLEEEPRSNRRDLAVRDPGDVSKRWIWAWAASKLFWKTLGLSTTVFSGSCYLVSHLSSINSASGARACAVGTALGMLASIGAFYADVLVGISQTILGGIAFAAYIIGIASAIATKRDGTSPTLPSNLTTEQRNFVDGYVRMAQKYHFYHHDEAQTPVMHGAIKAANVTHPLNVHLKGSHVLTPTNITVWSEPHPVDSNRTITVMKIPSTMSGNRTSTKKRDSYDCSTIEANQDIAVCGDVDDTQTNDWPDYQYLGMDAYGSHSQILEWDEDMGDYSTKKRWDYAYDNGFYPLGEALADELLDYGSGNQAWEGCVCNQVNGNWISTGSWQMTWNYGSYNGYDVCWNAGCDGADS